MFSIFFFLVEVSKSYPKTQKLQQYWQKNKEKDSWNILHQW